MRHMLHDYNRIPTIATDPDGVIKLVEDRLGVIYDFVTFPARRFNQDVCRIWNFAEDKALGLLDGAAFYADARNPQFDSQLRTVSILFFNDRDAAKLKFNVALVDKRITAKILYQLNQDSRGISIHSVLPSFLHSDILIPDFNGGSQVPNAEGIAKIITNHIDPLVKNISRGFFSFAPDSENPLFYNLVFESAQPAPKDVTTEEVLKNTYLNSFSDYVAKIAETKDYFTFFEANQLFPSRYLARICKLYNLEGGDLEVHRLLHGYQIKARGAANAISVSTYQEKLIYARQVYQQGEYCELGDTYPTGIDGTTITMLVNAKGSHYKEMVNGTKYMLALVNCNGTSTPVFINKQMYAFISTGARNYSSVFYSLRDLLIGYGVISQEA